MCCVSCATRASRSAAGPEITPDGFVPACVIAGIAQDAGASSDPAKAGTPNDAAESFSRTSDALWVSREVMALRRAEAARADVPVEPYLDAAANIITDKYVIVECHVFSDLKDENLAQDAVGFHGISAYLLDADGRKTMPLQTIIGTPVKVEENASGKRFSRTNLIVFSKNDVWTGAQTLPASLASVRLVLECPASRSYFEWAGASPSQAGAALSPQQSARILETGFTEFYEKVFGLTHLLD